ncbi:hypothetical protein P4S72_20585 [Vibrio sp. PP-XX7]
MFAIALDKQAKFPFEKFNELLIPSDKKADEKEKTHTPSEAAKVAPLLKNQN